jgi:branched-chain amino acid transport system substrate-binding protein
MLNRHIIQGRTLFSVVTCLLVVLAGLSACAQDQATVSNTFTDPNHPITIGISLSSKGDFKDDGQAMEQGYKLWASMVNTAGGLLGRPVVLKILHDDSQDTTVKANYQQLMVQDKVDLILGPYSSLLTKAVAPVALQHNYALVEGAGGAPSVFANHWSNLFDVSLPVKNNLITFAYYILSLPPDQRPRRAAYLSSNDPFTFPQVDEVKTLLAKAGVTMVYPDPAHALASSDGPYKVGDEYFDEEAKSPDVTLKDAQLVAQSKADVVILGTLLPDIKPIISEFKKLHYNPHALVATAGPDAGQDFINAVGGMRYTEGFFVPNGWYPTSDTYQNSEMVQAYLNTYGGTQDQINADVAEAFSVGQVVQQAVEKLGVVDNTKLIQELQSRTVFNTVQGTVQFDGAGSDDMGQNLQAIAYLFQWQGGQFIPVYPYSNAAENPEYPKPANF